MTLLKRPPDGDRQPLLSIAVPAYNRVPLLRRCLDSVLSQANDEIELLISDDSTTDAPGILARDILESSAVRSSYVRNVPSRGMAANWNACIGMSSGRYVLVLHDDDFLYPGAVSRMTNACRHANWTVGLFDVAVVNEQEKRVRPLWPHRTRYLPPATALRRVLSNSSYVRFPGMVIARSAYETLGTFDAGVGPAADLDMWIRLFGRYGLWKFSGLTAGYRVHAGALTSEMWKPEVLSVLDELFSQVMELGILPRAEIERNRAAWFHRFILAGAVRELRHGRRDRARDVMRLFDLPDMRSLQSSVLWRCLRASFSLLLFEAIPS